MTNMLPIHYFQFYIFSLCVNLFSILTYIVYYSNIFSIYSTNVQKEYDYIIVGSGTAGSLIAHRLATETNHTFIILEAGSRSNALFEIPVLGPMLHGSMYDWQYETVPQKYACYAMDNNRCKLPQGKIFGGSSKLNNMIHVRGNTSHYVEWFHGKYTQKYIQEQFEYIEKNILHLNELQYESELANAILQAAIELGYNILDLDFKLGFRKSKLSQRNGRRWSTSDNSGVSEHVLTNVLVEKLLINDKKTYGVQYISSDRKHRIYAEKGIILSSGTYNTPKILQLSGIGPSKLLKSLGIPLIKDLPVGENLQDHLATGLDLVLFNNSLNIGVMDMLNPFNLFNYFLKGKGPLTTPGCEVIAFLSTKNQTIPDLQLMVLPVGISSDRGSHLRKVLSIKHEVWHGYFAKTFDRHTATILPIILHPKSKGTVYIGSSNAEVPPLINPNYLSDKQDREILLDGLKFINKIIKTKPLEVIGAYINPMAFPGCENFELSSDEYWLCYIKHLTLTSYHPVGTCSMGLSNSSQSVVDTSFRVLGVDNLYVADGSVLPALPSGNINAAIAMMASVFFDAIIKNNTFVTKRYSKIPLCSKYDFLYEYIFYMCIVYL